MPYEPLEPFEFDKYTDPRIGLGKFFDYIWGLEYGYAYLPTLNGQTGDVEAKRGIWPVKRDQIVNYILEQNAAGNTVWFSPALYDFEKIKNTNPGEKSFIKGNIIGSNVIWCEHDGSALTALAATESNATPTRALSSQIDPASLLGPLTGSESVPVPSMRVQTSAEGREHWYWRLDEFERDITWIESMNRSITYTTRADTSGWDITQVLRPPYTNNHKYQHKPIVTVAYHNDNVYLHENFADIKPVQELVSNEIDVSNLPSVDRIIAKYPWNDDDYELFRRDSVPVGDRSFALMRLGYICAENGLKEAEIYAILDDADKRWKKYVKRSDRHRRLLDIVNRAVTKHPRALSELSFDGLIGPNDRPDDIESSYGFMDFLELDTTVDWAIQGMLDSSGMGLITSAPGVGKTQFSLQLAYSCATGQDFLGYLPIKPMRIMFYSLEMSVSALKMFVHKQTGDFSLNELKLLQDNLQVRPRGLPIPIEYEEARIKFEAQVAEFRPDGIVIDSLGKLASAKLDEEACRKINNFLTKIRRKYNCFVWLVHHNRKASADNKRPTNLDDIYGSVYITAEASVAMTLWRPNLYSNEIQLITNKNRLSDISPVTMLERGSNLMFTVKERYITADNIQGFQNITNDKEVKPDAGKARSTGNI